MPPEITVVQRTREPTTKTAAEPGPRLQAGEAEFMPVLGDPVPQVPQGAIVAAGLTAAGPWKSLRSHEVRARPQIAEAALEGLFGPNLETILTPRRLTTTEAPQSNVSKGRALTT